MQVLPEHILVRLEGVKAVERAVLNHGEILDMDFVVIGMGIRLNTELAQEAGLAVCKKDHAVLVDEKLRTSDPNIFTASFPHKATSKHKREVENQQKLPSNQKIAEVLNQIAYLTQVATLMTKNRVLPFWQDKPAFKEPF